MKNIAVWILLLLGMFGPAWLLSAGLAYVLDQWFWWWPWEAKAFANTVVPPAWVLAYVYVLIEHPHWWGAEIDRDT